MATCLLPWMMKFLEEYLRVLFCFLESPLNLSVYGNVPFYILLSDWGVPCPNVYRSLKREYLVIIRDNFCLFWLRTYVVTLVRLSRWDGSDEGSQHMVLLRNKKNCLELSSNTPSYLDAWMDDGWLAILRPFQLCFRISRALWCISVLWNLALGKVNSLKSS